MGMNRCVLDTGYRGTHLASCRAAPPTDSSVCVSVGEFKGPRPLMVLVCSVFSSQHVMPWTIHLKHASSFFPLFQEWANHVYYYSSQTRGFSQFTTSLSVRSHVLHTYDPDNIITTHILIQRRDVMAGLVLQLLMRYPQVSHHE